MLQSAQVLLGTRRTDEKTENSAELCRDGFTDLDVFTAFACLQLPGLRAGLDIKTCQSRWP